jgi:hypothetical protein
LEVTLVSRKDNVVAQVFEGRMTETGAKKMSPYRWEALVGEVVSYSLCPLRSPGPQLAKDVWWLGGRIGGIVTIGEDKDIAPLAGWPRPDWGEVLDMAEFCVRRAGSSVEPGGPTPDVVLQLRAIATALFWCAGDPRGEEIRRFMPASGVVPEAEGDTQ